MERVAAIAVFAFGLLFVVLMAAWQAAMLGTTAAWAGRRLLLVVLLIVIAANAMARDLGQWEATDHAMREWYQGLMQPDVPKASCCGEADAYWCDDYRARGGKAYCTISDDRPDEPRGRPHIAVGTEIEIPTNKLKWDSGNPTGHGVVFLSRQGFPFCYVQPGGA